MGLLCFIDGNFTKVKLKNMDLIQDPWPWYVAGPAIFLVMAFLFWLGYSFGISSTMRTICAACGGGRAADFFRFNWKSQTWNLLFVVGVILGGFIAHEFMSPEVRVVDLNPDIKAELMEYGMSSPGVGFQPEEIFSFDNLGTAQGLIFMILGGFLVGFGTRYAGGCTSGHAITGLSSLQLPSLVAVIGFFIGGLFVTYVVLPNLLAL